jgi:hypothetical protein
MKKVEARLQKVAAPAGIASGGDEAFINSMKRLESAGKTLQKAGMK